MTEDALVGKQLGEYRLEALLAQGGMARVYRAVDVRLKRYVVVKVIDPPYHNDPDYIMRFEREAQAIARLDHSNIVRLYRYDEQEDWLYMAMQYVDGADLGTVLAGYRADHEFMDPEDARRIIREVCSALDYAHQKGIIHRDVKPANILLDRQGRAFLTDFGLALLTEVGTRGEIFGSPHYIAPEQAMSSAKAVSQSDLYSVGVILFEMFTGDVPFNAAEPLDIALLHMSEEPPAPRQLRPELTPELESVILKALAKDPDGRYPTGAALLEALEQALKARSTSDQLASRSTLRHQTIPERVALKLDQQPSPPVPAGVTPAPTPSAPPHLAAAPASVAPAKTRPMLLTGGVAVLSLTIFALLCLVVFTVPSLLERFTAQGSVSTGQASVTSTETASALQPAAPLTATSQADSVILTPTSTLVRYELLIVRANDGNSLIVINMTANVFPLSLLQLGDGKAALTGAAWDLDNLAGGACVGVWKRGEERDAPEGINCQLAGNRLQRNKKDLLADQTFVVYYAGEEIATCDQNEDRCLVQFSP